MIARSVGLVDALRMACPSGEVEADVPLSQLTRWGVGGSAQVVASPNSVEEVQSVMRVMQSRPEPMCVLGEGSNVLFDSAGFAGVIVRIGDGLSDATCSGTDLTVQGGASVPDVAWLSADLGLAGIEHIVGIPGTIGGLVIMNGGSLRRSIGDHVASVSCVDNRGQVSKLTTGECDFSYRSSSIGLRGAVVVEVVLSLSRGDREEVSKLNEAILEARSAKFPSDQRTCGSTFLSSPQLYSSIGPPGFAIEAVGLKGTRRGGAHISWDHANFFVNDNGATSDDLLWLIALARNTVRESSGVEMDCEVRYISPSGEVVPAHVAALRMFGSDLMLE